MVPVRELTSIEINRVISELEKRLENSRLRKFYDLGDGAFKFLFYKKEESTLVYCKLLRTFNQTEFAEKADDATPFAMGVRKRLENATLTGIFQYNSDRMIVLDFGKEGYRLIIEMFGKGNIILINNTGRIEICYRNVRYRDRSVGPGNSYTFPGDEGLSFSSITEEQIKNRLNSPEDKKLISYLSDMINIGPIYLEDVIKRSGFDPRENASKIKDMERIVKGLVLFFERIKEEKPRVYLEEGKMKDYSMVQLERYKELESKEYSSLNGLLDEIFVEQRMERRDEQKEAAKSKIKSNIEAQKELVLSTKKEIGEYSSAGNVIFSNMQAINGLISYLQKNRNVKIDEVKDAFQGIKIKKLDLKNKIVTIELD